MNIAIGPIARALEKLLDKFKLKIQTENATWESQIAKIESKMELTKN